LQRRKMIQFNQGEHRGASFIRIRHIGMKARQLHTRSASTSGRPISGL
jgi:hypothetical protein